VRSKNTETATSTLVDNIEKLRCSNTPGLIIFLDIKGAFDNIPYKALEDNLLNPANHVEPEIARWILHLLKTRCTTTTNPYTQEQVTICHTRGVTQGAVLSPLIRDFFFDGLIRILANQVSEVIAYADDLCLISSNPA
jgi:hypothetical protein